MNIFIYSFIAEEEEKQEETSENAPDGVSDPLVTPKPVRALINGERGGSSVIKYKITSTPGYVSVFMTHFSAGLRVLVLRIIYHLTGRQHLLSDLAFSRNKAELERGESTRHDGYGLLPGSLTSN